MQSSLIYEGKEYISAKRAAEKIGYSSDYIGQLCRAKKIPGKLIGKTWYVDLEFLNRYKQNKHQKKAKVFDKTPVASTKTPETMEITGGFAIKSSVPKNEEKAEKPIFKYESDYGPRLPEIKKSLKPIASKRSSRRVARSLAMSLAAIVAIFSGMAALSYTSPSTFAKIEKGNHMLALTSAAGDEAGKIFGNIFGIFANLKKIAFDRIFVSDSEQDVNQSDETPGESTIAIVSVSEPLYVDTLRQNLLEEIENYISSRPVSSSQPLIVNNYYPTTFVQGSAVEPVVYNVVTRQSDADSRRNSRAISSLADGGTFTDATISGGTATFDTFCLTADTCITSWPAGGGGGGGEFAWDAESYGVSTSTTLGLLSGFLSTASSTISGGLNIVGTATATTLVSDTICLTGDNCISTWPSGGGGGSGTIGTSSNPTIGDLAVWTSANELASIATSSLAINTDDLVEGSNLYFTNARADARIGAATSTIRGMFSASSPIFYNSFMGAFSIHQANVAQDGYLSSSDWNLFNNKVSSSSLSALLGDYLTLSTWYATTTDGLDEGANNLYFTNARVQTYLDTLDKGYFFSTTSANHLLSTVDNNLFFSTTSADYWESTQTRWATSSSNYWAHSSTTLAKTYTANTFSPLQTFASGIFTNASSTIGGNLNVSGQSYFGGNVGIGVESPLHKLEIAGDAKISNSTGRSVITFGDPGGALSGSGVYVGRGLYSGDFEEALNFGGFGGFTFSVNDTPNLGGTTTPKMVITTNGDIGIGTTNPATKLDILGTASSSNLFVQGSATTTNLVVSGIATSTAFCLVGDGCITSWPADASFSTTSADYWETQQFRWATTSSDYWLTQQDTGDLAEGSNLYFTNARADARIGAATSTIRGMLSAGSGLSYNSSTGEFANTGVLSIGGLTGAVATSSLGLPTFSDLGNYFSLSDWYATTTDGLAQGSTNRYYSSLLFASDLAATTTDALAEGNTNLYWTDARFDARLSATTSLPNITTLANLSLPVAQVTGITGGTGITYNAGDISFDCSEVEGTGINCSGENITLDTSGNWTGTFDGQEGSYYLANSFSTTSAAHHLSTIDKGYFFSTTSADYWESTQNRYGTSDFQTDLLTGYNSVFGNSTTSHSTSTSLYSSTLTTGNATTTSLFATTLSATSLSATNAAIGSNLSVANNLILANLLNCNSSSQALQSDGSGVLSCGTITGGGASVGGGWTSISPNIVRLSTTTDLVGIGVTSPDAKLDISSGNAATTTLSLSPVVGQTANILEVYNTSLNLDSVISAGGFLGLGTSNPSTRLEVNGTASTTNLVVSGTATSTAFCLVGDGCITSWPADASFSTTSADYWETQQFRWATTSSDYWLTQQDTGDLAEGSNLYFTNARADARIGAATSTIRGMFSAGSGLSYNSLTGEFANTGVLSIGGLTGSVATSSLGLPTFSDLGNYFSLSDWYATTTDGLAQGSTNRYYSSLLFASDLAATTTDALAEGNTNLYWTDARFDARLSATTSLPNITTLASLSLPVAQVTGITGGTGITYNAGAISFDCSEVEGTGINCSGENITLDATGNWTGTFDGQEGSYYLANSFSTTSAAHHLSTIDKGYFFSTTSANYWAHSSTTLAKTYTANTFSPLQTFTSGIFTNASSTIGGNLNVSGQSYFGGNVGIGTDDPQTTLDVDASTSFGTASLRIKSNDTAYLVFAAGGGGNIGQGSIQVSDAGSYGGTMTFHTTNSSGCCGGLGEERLRIDNQGRVGIGTTSPYAKLSVAGSSHLGGNVTATGTLSVTGLSTFSSGINVGGETITDFTGLGLTLSSGSLNVATSTLAINTDDLVEGSNLFYTNTRVQTYLDTLSKGYFFSTTSADYWGSTKGYSTFGYLFPNNATSTLLSFNGGLTSYASTTIGNGTASGGLTIAGNATTTGDAYFAGNVGIGTNSPGATLEVRDSFDPRIIISAGGPYYMSITENTISANSTGLNDLAFQINGSTKAVVDGPTGYFGIGTDAPSTELDVLGTSSSTNLFVQGTATTTNLAITGLTNSLLSTNANGGVVATTSIGSNLITGSLGTINGTNFNRGDSITVSAASSTLLGDNNTWTGNNTFIGSNAYGTPSSITLTNATGLPVSSGITGLGTGVATALGVNIGTAGSFVVNGGALGTPSSGTLTNATGLPIVGGTTGTLTVSRGGTGATSFTDNRILTGNGTSAITDEANLTFDGSLLNVTGTGRISTALQVGTGGSYESPLHVNMQDVPSSPHASSLLTLEHNSQDVALSIFNNSSNDGAIYFGRTGTTDAGRIIYDHGTDSLLLGANSSANQLFLSSNGRVGIGTTNPATTLDVQGTASSTNLNVAGNTTLANATSSSLYTTTLGLNSEYFTDLTGTGLTNTGGALTLDTTGDWTGTFDGQEGSYYLANSFSTTSAAHHLSTIDKGYFFSTTSADYWGSTKGYSTFGYLFPNNATSTLLTFSGGIISNASTTIGGGTASTGLTINGNATTTGNAYFADGISIDADTDGLTVNLSNNSGQPRFAKFNNAGNDFLSIKFTESGTGDVPQDVWQFSSDGNVARDIAFTRYNLDTILYIDVSGAVGINTNSPATELDVQGTASSTNLFVQGGATSSSLYTSTLGLNSEYFTDLTGTGLTNTSGVLTLDATGNWTGTFDGQEGSYYLANSFSTTSALAHLNTLDKGYFFSTTSADYYLENGGLLAGFNAIFGNSTTTNSTTTGSAYFAGNVGIGAAPSANLTEVLTVRRDQDDVTGLLVNNFNTGSGALAVIGIDSDAGGLDIGMGSSASGIDPFIWTAENLSIVFGTNDTERLRITNNGLVGIGTTNPATELDVLGTASSTNLFVQGYATSTAFCLAGDGCITSWPTGGAFSTTSADYWLENDGLLAGYNAILGNATVTNSTTTGVAVFEDAIIYDDLTVALDDSQYANLWIDTNGQFNVSGTGDIAFETGDDFKLFLSNDDGSAYFSIFDVNENSLLHVLSNGNIGIGTDSPSTDLEIIGTASTTNLVVSNSALFSSIATFSSGFLSNSSSTISGGLTIAGNATTTGDVIATGSFQSSDDVLLSDNTSRALSLLTNGCCPGGDVILVGKTPSTNHPRIGYYDESDGSYYGVMTETFDTVSVFGGTYDPDSANPYVELGLRINMGSYKTSLVVQDSDVLIADSSGDINITNDLDVLGTASSSNLFVQGYATSTAFCLAGDGCITSWPTAGSGPAIGGDVTGGAGGSVLFVDSSGDMAQDNSNFYWDDTNNRLGIGTNSLLSKLNVTGSVTTSGSSAIAGTYSELSFSNSTASGFQFGNRTIGTISGSTQAATQVGEFIRMLDNTSLANTVRGLEVQAWSGSNTAGVNTGIATFGKTFGIQAETDGLAGGVALPAAVFAELSSATQGNAIRAYSETATSTDIDLVSIFHTSSGFAGDALEFNLAAGSGTFNGNFFRALNGGTEYARLTATGTLFASLRSAGTSAVCHVTNGAVTNDELTDCAGSVAADYAELYPVEEGVDYGHLVSIGTEDVTTTEGNIVKRLVKSNKAYDSTVVGIVSNNWGDFSSTGYVFTEEDNAMPVALNGRVPVKANDSNGPIAVGDYLAASDVPGEVMRATEPGMAVGIAMSELEEGSGEVLVFVRNTWYAGNFDIPQTLVLEEGGEGTGADVGGSLSPAGILSYIVSQLAAVFNVIIENGSILVDNIFGKKIVAEEELCIEDVCVDRDTLEALLLNAGLEPAGGSEEDTGTATTSSSDNSNASSIDNTDIDSTASSTPSDDVASSTPPIEEGSDTNASSTESNTTDEDTGGQGGDESGDTNIGSVNDNNQTSSGEEVSDDQQEEQSGETGGGENTDGETDGGGSGQGTDGVSSSGAESAGSSSDESQGGNQ